MNEKCPKDECWHWIIPGGSADISGNKYTNIQNALKKIKWTHFPHGGCSCTFGKCTRLHKDGSNDFFEPTLSKEEQEGNSQLDLKNE